MKTYTKPELEEVLFETESVASGSVGGEKFYDNLGPSTGFGDE